MTLTQSENNKSQLIDLLIITTIWIASIAIVSPLGEFPLNDDWAPAQTVKQLVETGSYNPSSWMAMTLITNIAWGALFCLPAGFSFLALRISTLAAGLIGMLAVYGIGKELKLPRPLRVVAALSLGFNPIYYAMSNTFMTDIPFTALIAVAALFFLRCLKDDSNFYLCAGIAIAIAATLSRQLGIAVPLAFAVAYVLRFGFGFRPLLRGLLPLVICIGVLLAFQHWLAARGQLPPIYLIKNAELISALTKPIVVIREILNTYIALIYLGWFLLPAMVLALPAIWSAHTRRNVSIWTSMVIAGGLMLAFTFFIAEPRLPLLGNILAESGIGPLTLRDVYILGREIEGLPHPFWPLLTWVGILGSVLIVAALTIFVKRLPTHYRPGKTTFEAVSGLFLLLCAAAYLFPLFTHEMIDRYLIPATPLIMLGLLSFFADQDLHRNRYFEYLGCILVAAFSFFSIGSTHDYLSWNTARWQALNDLTQVEKVSADQIDGGFEFNGWYSYDLNYVHKPDKSWWWVQEDTYMIGFQGLLGYTPVKEYPYSRWLPPYSGKIVVSKINSAFDF